MMPAVPFGQLARYDHFQFQAIEPRHVDVWTPPGYAESELCYPVIYMHDGQNLFDPALAYGGVDWGIIPAMQHIMERQSFPGAIVIGVWNSSQRWRDYMPAKALAAPEAANQRERFSEHAGGDPLSDHYLRFLVEELKPFIDRTYRTKADQAHTFVMGSSMGGLISLYAISEYPQVFGGAGCLSTHWPAGEEPLVDFMAAHLPDPNSHRLYFDFGTATLDAAYPPYQQRMDEHLLKAGYLLHENWITLKFEGAEHNEAAWRARVHLPLNFLLMGKG